MLRWIVLFWEAWKGWQRLLSLAVLVCSLIWVQAGEAVNIIFAGAPVSRTLKPVFSTKSGLRVDVNATWPGANGYRPFKVTFSSAGPVPAEMLITFKLRSLESDYIYAPTAIERDITFPQGASSTTATLLVPQLQEGDTFEWEIWVDGVKDEMISSSVMVLSIPTNDLTPVLFCSPLEMRNRYGGALSSHVCLLNYPNIGFDFHWLAYKHMPENWLEYSGISLVAIEAADFELLQEDPARLEVLSRYVRAGGNLWVFDAGEDFEKLGVVESALRLGSEDASGDSSLSTRGWRCLPLSDKNQIPENELSQLIGSKASGGFADLTLAEQQVREDASFAVDSRHWFVARGHGLGVVAAFRDCHATERKAAMVAAQRSLLSRRILWGERHGNDPKTSNPKFYDWLIPGVGTAPVYAFQLLISLFVIGIGPLNYWLLKRSNRLPLLLVTVPVSALVATLLLFAYGFVVDGIAIQARVRSLTVLDQRVGEAACWSRISYYAGIAPSEGLQMPLDTAIYPMVPRGYRNRYSSNYAEVKEIRWDEQQNLSQGWLGARSPTQYLTVAARASAKRLDFKRRGEELVVANKRGVDVLLLLVQDHEGNWHRCNAMTSKATIGLEPIEETDAFTDLRLLFNKNLPEFPAGFVADQGNRGGWYGGPSASGSLMETEFKAMSSSVVSTWSRGSYVAITRTGVEVSLGHADVVESDSLHVIRGAW